MARDTTTARKKPPRTPAPRTPPHSLEAETAVLGGILLDNEAIHLVEDKVTPDDFYHPAHATIFAAMLSLRDRKTPTDVVTLTQLLREQGTLAAIGGAAFLTALVDAVPSAAYIESYVRIVKERSVLRAVIRAAADIQHRGYGEVPDVDKYLDDSQRDLTDIASDRARAGYRSMGEVVKDSVRAIDILVEHGGHVSGVPTGFTQLDEKTLGLQRSDLVIIAGRPSMGKTSFALGVAEHAALDAGITTAIFSLEMSAVQLGLRMLSSQAGIDSWKIRRGMLGEEDWDHLVSAAERLGQAPVYIDDTAAISILELSAKARRLHREHDLGLILVDYMQLMRARPGIRYDSREKEISEISQSLKALAKELNLPVVALSQLNRRVEDRSDKRPMLSDLRESGAIEQDADVILFVYREAFYQPEKHEAAGRAEIIIGKQRNGPIGTVHLAFIGERSTFADLEEPWDGRGQVGP